MQKLLMKSPSSRYFYPWPVVLVTTVDADGKPNIIKIGASSICSSAPPVIGIAVGTPRYSLELMNRTGDFGVNLPTAQQAHETDFCGTRSGRDTNKFEALGLTVQPSTQITSPLILQSPVSFECRIVQTAHLGSHDWVMGEIVAVHIARDLIDDAGQLDFSLANPLMSSWGEYWTMGEKLAQWGYSKG